MPVTPEDALRAGRLVVLPTDTVYGLCASPFTWEPADKLYRLKGRDPHQPSQLLTADVDALFECIPELRDHADVIVRTLLPGPYTLILPNPARRFRWLTGENQDAIGVRVAELPADAKRVVSALRAVVATSANLAGGRDPRRVEDIPESIREGVEVVLEAGELPGVPSTVLDFSSAEPRIIREGAASGEEALARVREVGR